MTASGGFVAILLKAAAASHPVVTRLIAQVAVHGVAVGRKASLCGDAGGEQKFIESLLKAGLTALSAAPAALARTKEAIARLDLSESVG